MNDILSIVVAGLFSCIILDILGYVLRLMEFQTFMEYCRRWTYI